MNTNDSLNLYDRQTNPTISEGSTGNDVIILQSKLKDLNYFFASITGSFDQYTKQAVINFQQDHNLTPNGIVDEKTWTLLYELTAPIIPFAEINTKPELKLGSTGTYVRELQTILTNLLYYNGSINGNFDVNTENAVKRFQINNRLTANGIVGRDTWSALSSLYSPLAICNENNNYFTYTVIIGDTLWEIARRFNTTVEAIKRLNNLTTNTIIIGQQLLIPRTNGETPPNYTTYTVSSGDTLWNIARRFNTSVAEIKSLNNLTSDILRVGQQLMIPNNQQTPQTYTVVAGDTLWEIARRFNTSVAAIKSLNNLTSDILKIGQQLMIPNNQQTPQTYTVVAGDTLWEIARRFNTSVAAIKSLNNLTSDILRIGQQLLIP